MGLYLSPYIGKGTRQEPFRPRGLDSPGASAIDLRPDCTCQDGQGIGYAFLWVPSGIPDPVGAIKLADDYGDALTMPERRRLTSLLRLDFSKDRHIQDAVETVLLRARGQFCGLRPNNGRVEAWLGSGGGKRRWVDFPVLAGGSISDSFTRANETPVAAPWTILAGSAGSVNLASNAITHVTASGDLLLYYNNAGGWNADQSSQWLYASEVGSSDWGPAVRIGSGSGLSGYLYNLFSGDASVGKLISGAFTQIEAGATAITSPGNTYKLSVTGTTLAYSINGTPDANSPATDASLTTAGNGAGCHFNGTGGSIDDALLTGEITAGGGGGAKNLMLLGVGGMVRFAALARLKEPVNRRTLAKLAGVLFGGGK